MLTYNQVNSPWQCVLLRSQQGSCHLLRHSFCFLWLLPHLPVHVRTGFNYTCHHLPILIVNTSHYKSWRLTGLYVFCAVLFAGGFVIRAWGAFDYTNLVKYIVSVCLIYGAPYVVDTPSSLLAPSPKSTHSANLHHHPLQTPPGARKLQHTRQNPLLCPLPLPHPPRPGNHHLRLHLRRHRSPQRQRRLPNSKPIPRPLAPRHRPRPPQSIPPHPSLRHHPLHPPSSHLPPPLL